jgi:predicted anti-sigma-YlaC factor YlaD
MNCEEVRDLLALSAAGLLDATEARRVAEHVRECAACATELEALGDVAGALGSLPAPHPPAGLVYETQLAIAAEADRRQGARLAVASGGLAWVIALATLEVGQMFVGGSEIWIWTFWCTAVAGAGSLAVAALVTQRARRSQS